MRKAKFINDIFKSIAVLGVVNALQASANQRHASLGKSMRQIQRSLPAKLHNHANHAATARALINAAAIETFNAIQRVLKRERLEEK